MFFSLSLSLLADNNLHHKTITHTHTSWKPGCPTSNRSAFPDPNSASAPAVLPDTRGCHVIRRATTWPTIRRVAERASWPLTWRKICDSRCKRSCSVLRIYMTHVAHADAVDWRMGWALYKHIILPIYYTNKYYTYILNKEWYACVLVGFLFKVLILYPAPTELSL